jgi:hypothetical protein
MKSLPGPAAAQDPDTVITKATRPRHGRLFDYAGGVSTQRVAAPEPFKSPHVLA